MKVAVVGTGAAKLLTKILTRFGVNAVHIFPLRYPNPFKFRKYDIVLGVYIYTAWRSIISAKIAGCRAITYVIGSDAIRYYKGHHVRASIALRLSDIVIYVSPQLRELVGISGPVIPIPIDTQLFKPIKYDGKKRDILYYCPDPNTYRLEWILNYARLHPKETITVLALPQRFIPANPPQNILFLPLVQHDMMPHIYAMHKRLIRMTTHDGMPKMPYEALLCGLEVWWNGKRVTQIPPEMLPENAIPKLLNYITK